MAIGIVVVGLGPRGQDWLREIQTNPAYELAACVDIDRPTLNQAAGKLSLPPGKCFTELGEALDRNNCDAVIVATSATGHVEPCKLALERFGRYGGEAFHAVPPRGGETSGTGGTKGRAADRRAKLSLYAFVPHGAPAYRRRSAWSGRDGRVPVLSSAPRDGGLSGAAH